MKTRKHIMWRLLGRAKASRNNNFLYKIFHNMGTSWEGPLQTKPFPAWEVQEETSVPATKSRSTKGPSKWRTAALTRCSFPPGSSTWWNSRAEISRDNVLWRRGICLDLLRRVRFMTGIIVDLRNSASADRGVRIRCSSVESSSRFR